MDPCESVKGFACTASLTERMSCPGCKQLLTRHCILYRRQCKLDGKKTFEIRKQKAAAKMDKRIEARIAAQEMAYDAILAN